MNTREQLRLAVKNGTVPERQAVAVSYRPRPAGRIGMVESSKSVIWSPFFDTDPKAAWYDHGKKTFLGNRAESLPLALKWASEQYGVEKWKGNAMGDKVPAVVHKAVPMKRLEAR